MANGNTVQKLNALATFKVGRILVSRIGKGRIPKNTIDRFFELGTKIIPNTEKELREAADKPERADDETSRAVKSANMATGNIYKRCAELCNEDNNFGRALWEYAKAGTSYLRAGAYIEAAEAFEKAEKFNEAAEAFALGGFFDEALEMLKKMEPIDRK
ncbi:MAG: hypothetical protein WC488_01460 [Candidatus Micrarchaeia archaeon]